MNNECPMDSMLLSEEKDINIFKSYILSNSWYGPKMSLIKLFLTEEENWNCVAY